MVENPKVSIIWVNYNSKSFIDISIKSLESLTELDYPNYEVIVIDNHSIDGSFEIIKKYVESKNKYFKIFRTQRNIGFTGGNNLGFKMRDKDSKYVVLVNNDAIIYPESLKKIIEWMESESQVGAGQGVVLAPSGKIEGIGYMLDELLTSHGVFRGMDASIANKPLSVTYVVGAYAVYNVRAVMEVWGGEERLFFDWGFGYFDDHVLGLQLWNTGWKCRAYPVLSCVHQQSMSFKRGSPLRVYLSFRNLLLLNAITNSRYKNLVPLLAVRDAIPRIMRACRGGTGRAATLALWKSLLDYNTIKEKIIKFNKIRKLDLYKAPIIKLNLSEVGYLLILRRKITDKISKRILSDFKLRQSSGSFYDLNILMSNISINNAKRIKS